ncbi:MAG: HAD-IIB family hydrolase [Acidobacteriota bacterium]|nr:HAD-IIB family hydrolase [Acidobacteriota bacterium]
MSGPDDTRLVVTDLDGTLLDEETYDLAAARPGLDALRARRIALVLCSSKTRAEMEALADELDLEKPLGTPLIVENGGAVVIRARALPRVPPGGQPDGDDVVFPMGTPRDALVAALPRVAREAGVAVRSFAAMTEDEVAALAGLEPGAAARALRREWDEPFVIEGEADAGADARLEAAARRSGLRVSRGGRLHHLTGPADKGEALRALLRLLPLDPHGRNVGLGNAANDLSMLEVVDRPIVMPRRDGEIDAALAAALPGAERAPGPGPAGWAAAVVAVLAGESLPRIAA